MEPPTKLGVERFFRYEAAKLMELGSRMGSGQPPTRQQARNRRDRRLRLLHFLCNREILLSDSADHRGIRQVPTSEEWMNEVITDLPYIIDAVSQSSAMLALQPSTIKDKQ